jgi:predicted GNAT family acetyltransferase
LDDVRARGLTLTNFCDFVAHYIDAHPEYADLLDAAHPGHVLGL